MLLVILLLFILCLYLLFSRFFIEIDTTTDLYRICFDRLTSVTFFFLADPLKAELRILGWKSTYDFKRTETKKINIKKKKPQTYFSQKSALGKITGIAHSFKVTRCFVTIDTGNMPLNGVLYPWFHLLSIRTGKNMAINFSGENIVILKAENSLARLLWAYIKS